MNEDRLSSQINQLIAENRRLRVKRMTRQSASSPTSTSACSLASMT